MSWWRAIEDHVAERERTAPDPWAGLTLGEPGLTPDQEEFLAGLDDQPRPPRLSDAGSHTAGEREGRRGETGNSPGDDGGA